VDQQRRLVQIGKLDLPDPAREGAMNIRRDPAGQPRLAHTSHARQGDQPTGG
jgi:hypothetical protein